MPGCDYRRLDKFDNAEAVLERMKAERDEK